MKKTIDKKGIAKSLYLDGNYTQEEIADKVGTTRQTVSRWVKAENWEEIKASVTITPAQIIAQWNRQIVEINKKINARPDGERFATTQEADALSDCVSVAMRFLSWLRPLDIEAAKQFNNLFDAFIKDQAAGTKS